MDKKASSDLTLLKVFAIIALTVIVTNCGMTYYLIKQLVEKPAVSTSPAVPQPSSTAVSVQPPLPPYNPLISVNDELAHGMSEDWVKQLIARKDPYQKMINPAVTEGTITVPSTLLPDTTVTQRTESWSWEIQELKDGTRWVIRLKIDFADGKVVGSHYEHFSEANAVRINKFTK